MKKIIFFLAFFFICGVGFSQTPYDTVNVYDPQNFTEWTATIDTASVQAISRKAGLNRRINYNTLKKYFAPDVLLGWIGSDLDSTGIAATYYNQFVTDSQGDVWFVDIETGQGKRVLNYQQGKIDSLSFYGDTLRLYEDDSATPFKAKISAGATLTQEQVEDYTGAMVTGNTETLITVTYEDGDGTLDFVVDGTLSNYTDDLAHVEESTTVTDAANGLDITLSTYDIAIALDLDEAASQAPDKADVLIYEDVTDGGIHSATVNQLPINELTTQAPGGGTVTFDAESRYQKLFETDMSSASASVTVTLSNPTTSGVYTYAFTDITGTQEIVWPATVKGLDGVALGTVTYSGSFIKTCYYNGTNYICPPDYEPNVDFAADSITTTTLTVDLEYDYQKVVEIDMTSCTSVTLTINNPVAGGVYTFHYWGVSGTDNVTWPGTFYDASGTALGTDALTAGTFYTCYYNPDRAKYYCK